MAHSVRLTHKKQMNDNSTSSIQNNWFVTAITNFTFLNTKIMRANSPLKK